MLLHEPLIVEYFIEMLRSLYVIEVESVIDQKKKKKDWRVFIIIYHCRPVWLRASVSCIRYSKKRKFRPKMRQNALGGRAPPGPAGGA